LLGNVFGELRRQCVEEAPELEPVSEPRYEYRKLATYDVLDCSRADGVDGLDGQLHHKYKY